MHQDLLSSFSIFFPHKVVLRWYPSAEGTEASNYRTNPLSQSFHVTLMRNRSAVQSFSTEKVFPPNLHNWGLRPNRFCWSKQQVPIELRAPYPKDPHVMGMDCEITQFNTLKLDSENVETCPKCANQDDCTIALATAISWQISKLRLITCSLLLWLSG